MDIRTLAPVLPRTCGTAAPAARSASSVAPCSAAARSGFVGAEANYDVTPNATLGAQATFGWGNYSFNYWNVRGWVNYYFNPDTKLRGDLGLYR